MGMLVGLSAAAAVVVVVVDDDRGRELSSAADLAPDDALWEVDLAASWVFMVAVVAAVGALTGALTTRFAFAAAMRSSAALSVALLSLSAVVVVVVVAFVDCTVVGSLVDVVLDLDFVLCF
ncbi:hypothetical protein IWZ03DRAFT_365161 [Phyllosticta citriasiana]|uniref:Secreted peptide n=1 Tax=Phyllosticta citriasiana TaxID=595635 RepID=A0ABR1KZB1_9PEZI